MNYSKLFFILVICYSTLSCQTGKDFSKLENRLKVLEDSLALVNTEISSLEYSIQDLRQKNKMDEIIENLDKIAYLQPGSNGYSTIKSDIGILTVSLDNVRPYANGSQVSLRWGNMFNATIDGLKMKLEWGRVNEEGSPINSEAKSREITFSESLDDGAWNNVDVVLQGTKPENLGFVRIKEVYHSGIRLTSQ